MIDDELLQELLAKASGLYNSGDYRGAIEAWKEALATDPSSQKAREGIQMARLLLGDWEPSGEVVEGPESAPAADGADAVPSRLTPAERAARVDEGVARVRALLRERQYSAAVEGARGLVPIDPDSDEVQRLVEEAQQAFESAPFIEEHLTLARELAAQERFGEAEAECHKVFALDPANPDARTLAAEMRARMADPAPDAGGVTMRMDVADLVGPREGAAAPAADADDLVEATDAADAALPDSGDEPAAEAATEEAIVSSLPDDLMEMDLAAPGTEGALDAADAPAEAVPAEPAPEATLSEEGEPEQAAPEQAPSVADEFAEADPEMVLERADLQAEEPSEEVVDARTVVPPSVRLVPRTGKDQESMEAFLEKTEDVVAIPLAPPSSAAPAAPLRPAAAAAASDPLGWEEELESLNIKRGEHDIVGRSALKNTTPPTPAAGEMDLSELLGDPADGMSGSEGPAPAPTGAAEVAPEPSAAPAAPLENPAAASEEERVFEERAAARPAPRARSGERESGAPAAPPRPRPSVSPMLFAILGVVILAGAGAVWWFVYQPQTAAAQAATPPGGNPPAGRAGREPGAGPIPTPLGSTPRQPAEAHPAGAAVAEVVPASGETQTMPIETSPAGAPAAGTATTATPAPPAPAPPRPSPEELRRRSAQHMSDGRRFIAAQKWQEARTELAAALALDPVNFECKEMLEQVQAKVDEEVKVTRDLDEARRSFADKDYQGALWKLYRPPRDPRLGDIDRYIRNSWYNWAVVGLKGGDATDARQKLSEVLTADPDDADAKKMLEVAERYSSRAKDRVYYSFTDNLRFRAFDQK